MGARSEAPRTCLAVLRVGSNVVEFDAPHGVAGEQSGQRAT